MVKDAYLKSQGSLFHDIGALQGHSRDAGAAWVAHLHLHGDHRRDAHQKRVPGARTGGPASPGDVVIHTMLTERCLDQLVQWDKVRPVPSRSIAHILVPLDLGTPLGPGNVRIAVAGGWRADPSKFATLSSLAQRHGDKAAVALEAARARPCGRCRHASHPKAICGECPSGEEQCRLSCARCLHPAHKGAQCQLCPPRTNRAFCTASCWRCRRAGTNAEHKLTGCSDCPAGAACHSAAPIPADAQLRPPDGKPVPPELPPLWLLRRLELGEPAVQDPEGMRLRFRLLVARERLRAGVRIGQRARGRGGIRSDRRGR
ncbi:hypothetical protein T492DRAFT_264192 [Pavlovales sp. CCMP2436]|nr:hypothetical protein T492DRAFT_264192 [Pavlovales sp. CCMP2436]